MPRQRTTLLWFSLALLVAAVLDCGSTVYAFQRMGGWHGEANPLFRSMGGSEADPATAVLLILAIKVTASLFSILWLASVMGRIPDLYPPPEGNYGFVRFVNNVAFGRDVPWWMTLIGMPPFKRMACFLGVPIATAIVVGGVAASITNTFGLLTSITSVIVFWCVSSTIGFLLGMDFLRRDFLKQGTSPATSVCRPAHCAPPPAELSHVGIEEAHARLAAREDAEANREEAETR